MRTIISKIKSESAFTLVETLYTMMIFLMVTTIVATGIPTATMVYKKIILSANADMLLSTTISALKNELANSGDVQVKRDLSGNKTTVYYYSPDFHTYSRITIDTDGGGEDRMIMFQRFAGKETISGSEDTETEYSEPIRLISKEASNKNLHVTYDSVDDSRKDEGLLIFKGLGVWQDGRTDGPVVRRDDFTIRLYSY